MSAHAVEHCRRACISKVHWQVQALASLHAVAASAAGLDLYAWSSWAPGGCCKSAQPCACQIHMQSNMRLSAGLLSGVLLHSSAQYILFSHLSVWQEPGIPFSGAGD